MEHLEHRSDVWAHVPDSEILTIAVVAAGYVGHHHERAAPMMREFGYLSGRIGVSRFHRRLHRLADRMAWIPANVGGASPRATGSSSRASPCRSAVVCAPGAVGRRRARMLRGVRGETGEGLWTACASGPPPAASAYGRVQMRPAGVHDLTPVHEPAYVLPAGARRLGDNADNSAADATGIPAETRVRLVPVRRATMRPHAWCMDAIEVRAHRRGIEMTNGQQSAGEDGRRTLDGRQQCRV
jgi:hypothetical protein